MRRFPCLGIWCAARGQRGVSNLSNAKRTRMAIAFAELLPPEANVTVPILCMRF